jgi:transposase
LKVIGDRDVSKVACSSLNRVFRTLNNEIHKLEAEIEQLVGQDEGLSKTFELCRRVKGVGLVLSLELIIHTQNFTCFDGWRKFVAYKFRGTSLSRCTELDAR